MEIYTLTRKGRLKPQGYTDNQCKDIYHSEYFYKTKITCSDTLDDDQFIIDQLVIHDEIYDNISVSSCEIMVKRINNLIYHLLKQHNKEIIIYSIKTKLYPYPKGDAYITLISKYKN